MTPEMKEHWKRRELRLRRGQAIEAKLPMLYSVTREEEAY
jgi:hypothetical protein